MFAKKDKWTVNIQLFYKRKMSFSKQKKIAMRADKFKLFI